MIRFRPIESVKYSRFDIKPISEIWIRFVIWRIRIESDSSNLVRNPSFKIIWDKQNVNRNARTSLRSPSVLSNYNAQPWTPIPIPIPLSIPFYFSNSSIYHFLYWWILEYCVIYVLERTSSDSYYEKSLFESQIITTNCLGNQELILWSNSPFLFHYFLLLYKQKNLRFKKYANRQQIRYANLKKCVQPLW